MHAGDPSSSSSSSSPASPSPRDWAEMRPLASGGVTLLNAHFTQHRFERHSHETYSIGVTRSGVQTFACRGARHASLAGDVILFNPDEPHDGSRGTDAGFGYSMLYVDAALVHALVADRAAGSPTGAAHYFKAPVVHDPQGALLLQRAVAAVAERQESLHGEERTAAAVQALLGRHGEVRVDWAQSVNAGRQRMALVREYLHVHFADDVTVQALATQAGLSRAHLTRAFTATYGMAPHAYLNMVRVRQAQAALRQGGAVADVAAACGFADQSHLTRRFKGQVGMAPGRWLSHMQAG
ncbi:AraC family transcriptional regulator [Acidovorax sp. LjRoot66]|uniref:AraC family transcriptional regulator n=1 Tax=Acidovorax sp. LjRoot66 TaxID=3342334 RepID=UPI003ECE36CE